MARRYIPRDGYPASLRGAWITEAEKTDDAAVESESEQPSVSASKSEWEDYAASLEVDTDGMTKDEIIDAVS